MTTRRIFLQDAVRLASVGLAAAGFCRETLATAQSSSRSDLLAMTLLELSQLLIERKVTSRELTEQALAAIQNPSGEGARTFIRTHASTALAAADRIDAKRRAGAELHPLAGIPISIKDLFDEAGEVSLAGSTVLAGTAAAKHDSTVVARLRSTGFVIVGRTNMTEFAYSGLGINPHYGTPSNVFDRINARLPGGSSSGAAISVTDGMAAAAIGSDTGGSVRIPAALNGLVGFKPTARRVPMDGMIPLSPSLDSAGPIAKTVADCAVLDQVLASDRRAILPAMSLRGLRLAVPTTVVQDDLSPAVAAAFSRALQRLSSQGATIIEIPLKEFSQATSLNPRGALTSVEAFAWHARLIKQAPEKYDPRVLMRIRPGENVSEAEHAELLRLRSVFIRDVAAATSAYEAILMPTTAETAPTIAEVIKDDESYLRFNGRMLRNPSLVNLFDGCALSVPCHQLGSAPVGLMIAGMSNSDRRILSMGRAIEAVVSPGPR